MNEYDFLTAFNKPWSLVSASDYPLLEAKRPAAVLICLFLSGGKLHVLFTQRASHLKHHAGQISFPGGKAEKTDVDLVATAYREAQEEIGLDPQHLRLLGRLGVYRTVSRFAVLPVVSIYDKPLNVDTDLIIDENEVANVFSVPLAYLMEVENYYIETVIRNKTSFPVYFIPFEQRMIWGATAGILAQLQKHIGTHF